MIRNDSPQSASHQRGRGAGEPATSDKQVNPPKGRWLFNTDYLSRHTHATLTGCGVESALRFFDCRLRDYACGRFHRSASVVGAFGCWTSSRQLSRFFFSFSVSPERSYGFPPDLLSRAKRSARSLAVRRRVASSL